MQLFDYIKVLFGKDAQWDKVSSYDKSRNSFMTNRFMSIKFPIQANLFNTLKIDPVGQAEAWRMVASKFNKVPGFIYTKVKKQEKEKQWSPDPKAVELYMKFNEIGHREFKECLKYNPSEVRTAIDILEKQMGNDVNRQ
jgi:hypothetical protein